MKEIPFLCVAPKRRLHSYNDFEKQENMKNAIQFSFKLKMSYKGGRGLFIGRGALNTH